MKMRIGGWYRGWTMVGIGIIMAMLSVGTVTYGYGIYVTPVSKELGLSRQVINSGIIFQHIGTAVLTPFIGHVLDRFRVSTVVLFSAFALAGSLVALSIGDALLPKAIILALPLSFAFSGAGSIASYVLVGRWFQIHRGRAMALVALGQSGSTIILAPVIASMIEYFGWRTALMWQGIIFGAILFLLSRMIVDRPAPGDVEPAPKSAIAPVSPANIADIGRPMSFRQLLTRPLFWLTASIVAMTLAVVQATLASLVPLATERGLTLVQGTTLLSGLGLSSVVGKFALAFVADRLERGTLLVLALTMILGFSFSLCFDLGYYGMLAASLCCGVGLGSFFPIYSSLLADRFGAASLGTSEGLVSPIISLSSAVAIYFAGRSFDTTGSYEQTFVVFTAILCLPMLLALSLRARGTRRARQVPAEA